jgi:hypothetical protein
MTFKKPTVLAIVLALVLIAGTTAAFAISANIADDNNKDLANSTAKIIDPNGNELPVSDGELTLMPSDNSLNGFAAPFFFGRDELLDKSITVHGLEPLENADVFDFSGSVQGFVQIDLVPPTYTEEDLAQIIAKIESGEIQPAGIMHPDGTFEWLNRPDEIPEDAEVEVLFTPFN